MIYLDTHIVVWLYYKGGENLSVKAKKLIRENEPFISPIVQLEIQYLKEVGKIKHNPSHIVDALSRDLALKVCQKDFIPIIENAVKQSWTRDPFDRIITAQAAVDQTPLLSCDRGILKNYKQAVWE